MFFEKFKKDYEKIIEHKGGENQVVKVIEEMAELTIELISEKGNDVDKIAGEISDLFNMLNQMLLVFDIPVEVIQGIMEQKNERVLNRIKEERRSK
jgi:phosphoribosyl-ATP pyrophosphohydrolase